MTYAHLAFDVPIQRKLVVFCSAVGCWLVAVGTLGAISASDGRMRLVLVVATAGALVALVGFGVLLTRSLRQPIKALTRRVAALVAGSVDSAEDGDVITANDEVATLAARVDDLYTSFRRMAAFKAVIEEDETADEVYERLGSEFDTLGLPCHALLEISNSKNRLRIASRSEGFPDDCCSRDILLDADLCRAKRTGSVVSSLAFRGVCKSFQTAGREHVCVPVMVGGTTGGIATFLFEGAETPDAAMRLAKALHFIRESAGVLETKRLTGSLKQAMLRDPMTGLYNRRFLEEYTESLVASSTRRSTAVGVLMCDLDHFKQVNDTYGHDVGDAVLREIASVLVNTARAADIVVRFGGEEFLVVLQDSVAESAMTVAERIRHAVESARISTAHGVLKRTISIGVAEFPKDGDAFWDIVKLADLALYRAKTSGRNRCVRFQPEMRERPACSAAPPPRQPESPVTADPSRA